VPTAPTQAQIQERAQSIAMPWARCIALLILLEERLSPYEPPISTQRDQVIAIAQAVRDAYARSDWPRVLALLEGGAPIAGRLLSSLDHRYTALSEQERATAIDTRRELLAVRPTVPAVALPAASAARLEDLGTPELADRVLNGSPSSSSSSGGGALLALGAVAAGFFWLRRGRRR
jgi:hypothetical protein